MNFLQQTISNTGDESNHFKDKETITVFVADVFNNKAIESFENNIDSIVEFQGFSNGSLSIENELRKAYKSQINDNQSKVVFEIVLDKSNKLPKGILLKGSSID